MGVESENGQEVGPRTSSIITYNFVLKKLAKLHVLCCCYCLVFWFFFSFFILEAEIVDFGISFLL